MSASSSTRQRRLSSRFSSKDLPGIGVLVILAISGIVPIMVTLYGHHSTTTGKGLPSWNPAVSCTATLTTIENVIGNQLDDQGGASKEGGAFKPGIQDKQSTAPPCALNGNPTFVEIHSIQIAQARVGYEECYSYPKGQFCDTTFNIQDPHCSRINTNLSDFCRIHSEIDQAWKNSGIAPPDPPNANQLMDIQGFVYWDPEHVNASWHNRSGWEIHPLSAWRTASSPNPNPSPDRTPPTWQQAKLTTSNIRPNRVSLIWTAASDEVGVTNYEVYENGILKAHLGSVLTYNLTDLSPGTTYVFEVEAGDAANNWSVNGPTVTIGTSDFGIVSDTFGLTITTGASQHAIISITPTNGFTDSVVLTASAPPGLTIDFSPSNVSPSQRSTLTIAAAPTLSLSTFTIDVVGTSGPLVRHVSISVTVIAPGPIPGFTMSLGTPSVILAGSSGASNITVMPDPGFSGTVSFAVSAPASLRCKKPTDAQAPSWTSTLTCDDPSPGDYFVAVTGSSGSLTRTDTTTFKFVDFTITMTPPASVLADGLTAAVSTIAVDAVNGFAGSVSLSDTPLPSGLTCLTINLGSVTGLGTATLSCVSLIPNVYQVTVTGTSGSLTHTATTTFSFASILHAGFVVSASSPAPVHVGQTVKSTITITPSNGFTGIVTLSDNPLPRGLSCPAVIPVTITGTASASSTLSCDTSTPTDYPVTVTGTSGALTRPSNSIFFRAVDFSSTISCNLGPCP